MNITGRALPATFLFLFFDRIASNTNVRYDQEDKQYSIFKGIYKSVSYYTVSSIPGSFLDMLEYNLDHSLSVSPGSVPYVELLFLRIYVITLSTYQKWALTQLIN